MPKRRDAASGIEGRKVFWDQASHDLRQPVQSLQLLAQIFARHADADPLRQAAEHMRRVVEDLAQMHEALLQLTRLESGSSVPERRPVAIADLVGEIARELSATFPEPHAELRTRMPEHSLEADPAWLALILRSLAALALRHCDGDAVSIIGQKRQADFSVVIEFSGPDIASGQESSVFIEAAHPRDRRSILGPAYLLRLCELLGYRLRLGAAREGKRRLSLTIPGSAPPA